MGSHVKDKFPLLAELVKDKDVLDIGCVQHNWQKCLTSDWIHEFLRKHANSVFGIDILSEDIKKLKELGYDVTVANAEYFNLNMDFDVVFAGEIIEHLSNAGECIESCKIHLRKNGQIIITTVNCFSILFFVQYVLNKLQVNNEHTCWYDEVTLKQLLERYGFKVIQVHYFHRYETSDNPLKLILSKLFHKFCPLKLRDNLLIVAQI